MSKKANKRGLSRPKLRAERLEARLLLAADFDLAPHYEYMLSSEFDGHTNFVDNYDVNADGQVTAQDTIGVISALAHAKVLSGAPLIEIGQSQPTAAMGEGDAANESLLVNPNGDKVLGDINGDGQVDVKDAMQSISYLGEGEHGSLPHEAEVRFLAYQALNPAFLAPFNNDGTQGTPNANKVAVTEFRLDEPANLTVVFDDVRTAVTDVDKGLGSVALDVAFEQGFPFQVAARTDAFDNGAFVFNSVTSSAGFQSGTVFAGFSNPLGVRDWSAVDFNDILGPNNGPSTEWFDVSLEFSGSRLVALDDTEGVVQGQSVDVDVMSNDTLDDQFGVSGSAASNSSLQIVFQNDALEPGNGDLDAVDFGAATFAIRGPSGEVLEKRIQNVMGGSQGTASLNDNGTPTNFADDFITYSANAGASGQDTFTYDLTDGFTTPESATVTIDIGEVNDPPVLTVPATATTDENIPVNIGSSVTDPDALAAGMDFAIAAGNGNVSLSTTSGLTNVSGNGTTNLTFTGSQADASTALAGLTYSPIGEFSGSDTVTLSVDDLGNTGVGGNETDNETITVTVNSVNDPPVNTLPSGPLNVFNTETLAVSGVSVADIDAGSGDLTVDLAVGDGTLSFTSSAGLMVTGAGTGSLSATGTLSNLNTALGGLIYDPIDSFIGTDTLSMTTNDNGNTGGSAESDMDSVDIDVTPPRLPFARDDSLTVSEDSMAGASNEVDVFANDLNGLVQTGGADLTLDSYSQGADGSVAHNDNGTPTDLTDDIFTYVPNSNFFGADTFTYTISDSINTPNDGPHTGTVSITVTPVNDAPVVTVPGSQSIDEDADLSVPGVSVSDIDAGTMTVTVSIASTNGTVNVNPSGSSAVGNSSSAVTLNGTLTQLNNALGSMTYSPDMDYSGSAEISVSINDNGHTGGGDETDTKTISIAISPLNDAPVISVPGPVSTTKNFDFVFEGATPISVMDVDSGASDLSATVAISTMDTGLIGSIALGTPNTVDVTASSPISISFDGTLAEINEALDGLTYSPGLEFVGFTTVDVMVNDNGATGAGTAESDSESVVIEVLDFIPSSIGGFAFLDTNADATKNAIELGLGGIDVRLQGLDITGATIDLTTQTDSSGAYNFANLAPPEGSTAGYTVTINPNQASHYMDGTDYIGSQGGVASSNSLLIPTSAFLVNNQPLGGVTGVNNNFTFKGADARYVNVLQFILASSQSNDMNRLLLSVDSNGNANGWLNMGGWDSFTDFNLTGISNAGTHAHLQAINGSTMDGDLDFPQVREIGDDGNGNKLYWIEGRPADLLSQAEGEGESNVEQALEFDGEGVELLAAAMQREATQDFQRAADGLFADGDLA